MDKANRTTYRKRPTRARERQESRKRRHGEELRHAVRLTPDEDETRETPYQPTRSTETRRRRPQVSLDGMRNGLRNGLNHIDWERVFDDARRGIADGWWYIRRNPMVWRGALGLITLVVVVYLLSVILSGNIPRGVTVTGIGDVGNLSIAAATDRLLDAWENDIQLELIIDAENSLLIRPRDLGIRLDAEATAQAAKDTGLSALPFGKTVEPITTIDFITAQTYLLNIADQVNTRPSNARYELVNGQVVGIPGLIGRRLDTTSTLDYLTQNLVTAVERGRFELLMTPLYADFNDPVPHLAAAQALADTTFELRGYDPITNQFFTWPIQPQTLISWVSAGAGALILDSDSFEPYLGRLNDTLNTQDVEGRYLQREETEQKISDAITSGATYVDLRVRHSSFTYSVVGGDTAFRIGRKTGMPFYLIERANSGRDLNILSIGDVLNIPSPDEVMPYDPVPNKRIVVDLNAQYLMAFEDGQVVFEWIVSSGVRDAQTSPGVFQIISHAEKAYGSSNMLCNAAGLACGRWEMNWFMGIYQVMPGLENGFHGSVLLPNGGLLGDGAVGRPVTFGCVMSTDDQARMLYEWADLGTVVEIISNEFPPVSDLGRYMQQRLAAGSSA